MLLLLLATIPTEAMRIAATRRDGWLEKQTIAAYARTHCFAVPAGYQARGEPIG